VRSRFNPLYGVQLKFHAPDAVKLTVKRWTGFVIRKRDTSRMGISVYISMKEEKKEWL